MTRACAQRPQWTALGAPALALAATLVALAAPAPARAAEAAEANWPALTPAKAEAVMRSALTHQFGVAWTRARGHRLDCSTPVHPERGGATQQTEVRRRCRFSWSQGRTRYEGFGLVWLGGSRTDGSRHWAAQFRCTERTGRHTHRVYGAGEAPFSG
jgi:hypothetical protein